METITNFFLQQGIDQAQVQLLMSVLYVLVMVPVVGTIIGIIRYIIGLKNTTLYIPIIVTFAFYDLSLFNHTSDYVRGLKYGLLMYSLVLFTSILLYSILKSIRMHYLPKLTIIITGISIIYIAVIFLTLYFDRAYVILINSFTLVMVMIVMDAFVSAFAKKDISYAMGIGVRTLLIGILCYTFISLDFVKNIAMEFPYLVLIGAVILNIIIGRFKGLRLTEYWRFRKILTNPNIESDEQPANSSPKQA